MLSLTFWPLNVVGITRGLMPDVIQPLLDLFDAVRPYSLHRRSTLIINQSHVSYLPTYLLPNPFYLTEPIKSTHQQLLSLRKSPITYFFKSVFGEFGSWTYSQTLSVVRPIKIFTQQTIYYSIMQPPRVRVPSTSMLSSFIVKFVPHLSFEKNENKQKRAGMAHF